MSGRRGALVLAPFLVYVTIDYVFRVNSAMIAPALAGEFALDAADLGLVTGAFFAAFAAAQWPLGLLLDSLGPRRVVVPLLSIAVLGGLVYLTAGDLGGLIAGRFLLGIGMAASLMGGIKAASLWFPPERLPQIAALHVALAGLGGMLATGPMVGLLAYLGWRGVMVGLLCLCAGLVVAFLTLVPQTPRLAAGRPGLTRQLGEYRDILTSFAFWRVAPLVFAGVGVGIGYQTLWAGLWLRDVAGYGETARAWVLFAMFTGVLVGNLGYGWWVRRRLAAGGEIFVATLVGFAAMIVVQIALLPAAGGALPAVLWVAVSVLFAFPVAGFAMVAGGVAPEQAGRAASAVNGLLFLAIFATQWSSGAIIEAFPAGADGAWSATGHRAGLGAAVAVQVLAFIWCLSSARRRG